MVSYLQTFYPVWFCKKERPSRLSGSSPLHVRGISIFIPSKNEVMNLTKFSKNVEFELSSVQCDQPLLWVEDQGRFHVTQYWARTEQKAAENYYCTLPLSLCIESHLQQSGVSGFFSWMNLPSREVESVWKICRWTRLLLEMNVVQVTTVRENYL